MKTLLTFFVLLFSSSVLAEDIKITDLHTNPLFPNSLFGIKLMEPIKNYIKENEEKYVDPNYPELFSSYGTVQIIYLI